jgi:Na+/H+ antiporter NhaC
MALLMPLALPATLGAAAAQQLSPELTMTTIPMVIGAVFGGAVLGDHCSPFSDTTIVSSIAAGCEPVAHVHSQLPFAGMVAILSILGYALMALGLHALASTAVGFILLVVLLARLSRGAPDQESLQEF